MLRPSLCYQDTCGTYTPPDTLLSSNLHPKSCVSPPGFPRLLLLSRSHVKGNDVRSFCFVYPPPPFLFRSPRCQFACARVRQRVSRSHSVHQSIKSTPSPRWEIYCGFIRPPTQNCPLALQRTIWLAPMSIIVAFPHVLKYQSRLSFFFSRNVCLSIQTL